MAACSRQAAPQSVRVQPDGEVLVTDGPYTETKEHIGGFWVLEATDLDEAWLGPQGRHRLSGPG